MGKTIVPHLIALDGLDIPANETDARLRLEQLAKDYPDLHKEFTQKLHGRSATKIVLCIEDAIRHRGQNG